MLGNTSLISYFLTRKTRYTYLRLAKSYTRINTFISVSTSKFDVNFAYYFMEKHFKSVSVSYSLRTL